MKPKPTRFTDIRRDDCERRDYEVHRRELEAPSSRVVYFDCPWCAVEVKAFVWSLTGGGKRCECGALFGGRGVGHKLRPATPGGEK